MDMLHQIAGWLVHTVGQWGYIGIIALMFLESSFFPFPSEIVVPPAAYLAANGEMNLGLVILSGVMGSLLGAVFNYGLALRFGRPFFVKYGRYLLVSPQSLDKAEVFFARHGEFSTFIGRLLPGIRQYISLPAGLAKMNIWAFSIATALGAGIWVIVLAGAGYWFGRNEDMVLENLHRITIITVAFCVVSIVIYWWLKVKRKDHRLT